MEKANYPNAGEILADLQQRLQEQKEQAARLQAMTQAGGGGGEMPVM